MHIKVSGFIIFSITWRNTRKYFSKKIDLFKVGGYVMETIFYLLRLPLLYPG